MNTQLFYEPVLECNLRAKGTTGPPLSHFKKHINNKKSR